MADFLLKLFASDFMGHGYCYLWRPEIVWLHAVSDGIITLAYYVIPVILVYLVRKRRDLPFHWVFFAFGLFIVSCGTTHAMEIWTLWHGTYRLAGLIKAITAGASVATAIALVPMVPKALLLPSPAQLRAANIELEKEIAERRRVEEALQAQQEFVTTVLNTIGTLIVVLDLEGTIVQCNLAFARALGESSDRLLHKRVWDVLPSREAASRFCAVVDDSRLGGEPAQFESSWSTKDQPEVLVSWSSTILRTSAGGIRNIIMAGIDITESKQLEKAILDVSAREQARIGQDLHDGLGQHLTGTAFMGKVVEKNLAERGLPEAADVARVVARVNEAIVTTRELSRGLLPISAEASGLMSALERRAAEVRNLFGIKCSFITNKEVDVRDEDVATHLYRIAQEALNNSIKHSKCTRIEVMLSSTEDDLLMQVSDDGVGFSGDGTATGGMGLRIMNYRVNMIGGTLQVKSSAAGTTVACRVHHDG